MSDDHLREIRTMWANQQVQAAAIDVVELKQRASAFQRRVARRNLREYVAGALVIAIFGAYLLDASSWLIKLAALAVIGGCVYTMLELHRRAAREAVEPADPAVSCLAFHRAALERQRTALHDVWKWYLAPLAPGIVLFAVAVALARPHAWIAAALTLVTCALVFYGIHRLNRRAANHLQREIDALRAEEDPG